VFAVENRKRPQMAAHEPPFMTSLIPPPIGSRVLIRCSNGLNEAVVVDYSPSKCFMKIRWCEFDKSVAWSRLVHVAEVLEEPQDQYVGEVKRQIEHLESWMSIPPPDPLL
jgi:hypothetical protein